MIRAEVLFDFTRLEKISQFTEIFPAAMIETAKRTFNQRIRLGLLAQLRKYPKRRYWTREDFASDASRRAFFAKTGGKPYQRTGRLAGGWRTDISTTDNAIAFSVTNSVPYEKWVSGQDQVFGHAKTGWGLHEDIYNTWRPRVADTITDAAFKMIEGKLR